MGHRLRSAHPGLGVHPNAQTALPLWSPVCVPVYPLSCWYGRMLRTIRVQAGAAVRCESCLPTFDGEKEQELFRELEGAVKPGLQQVSKLPLTASNSTFMALSSIRNSFMERCMRASRSKASRAWLETA